MAGRTKEQAQATRGRILDAAELLFEQRGVSRTSLHEIAQAAGLTRGAIYWHFCDKADLFNAMMDRAVLPLEEIDSACVFGVTDITLSQMRDGFIAALRHVVADPQMKRVFDIATHKVELVGDMHAVLERRLAVRNACLANVERTLKLALRRGDVARRMPACAAALGLHSLLDGLLQNWMLEPGRFDLVTVGRQVLDAYLAGLALRTGEDAASH